MTASEAESAVLDRLDTAIIRALQIAPRAPFRLIGELLGVSEQTIARRYRRLRRQGLLRVTAVVSPTGGGQSNWIVRVQCRPSGAASLAQALAQRADVGWVSVSSGGTEVQCVIRSRTAAAREELMLQRLPRTAPVLGMTAAAVLHHFVGKTADDWLQLADRIEPAQEAQLRASADAEFGPIRSAPRAGTDLGALEASDLAMLDLLIADGRTPFSVLAEAGGLTEGRAMRRVRQLLRTGIAYLDVDLPAAAFGFHAHAALWLRVTPADVDAVGRALSREREVPFAAAITGQHNITATVICRDLDALYTFATSKIGAIPGVQTMEISPVLRGVKQAGALLDGERLAVPS
jgi:DNA-binding Lrp family transcriptional regulator